MDVNILLYASDRTSPMHRAAKAFLKSCTRSSELFCLTWLTLIGYVRMATHPRIFGAPLTPEAATENVDALLALPRVRLVAETEGFWDMYREVAGKIAVRGNLVPDAHLVALLRLHGISRLYTRDRDFRKFDAIVAIDPFE